MKFAKNRKFLAAIGIVLALVIGVSATFAWVTSKTQLANEFENEGFAKSNGLVTIEEEDEFKFEIGETTDKNVSILNTSESPMLARVTFEEMIKLLGNDGQISYADANTPAGAKTELSLGTTVNLIRVPFNHGTASLAGWTNVTSSVTWTGGTAPTGVEVWELDGDVVMYKACYQYETDKYQVVDFEGKMQTDGTIIDGTAQYGYYTEGTAKFNSWNAQHNYDDSTMKNQFIGATWNPDQALNYPTGTPVAYKPVATPGSPNDVVSYLRSTVDPQEISFEWVTANIITSLNANPALDEGKWFYNEADGYFYYIGVISGGATTEKLMTGVSLSGNADQASWQKYEYTLVVCVEGLQANVKALTDTEATGNAAGWQLNNTSGIYTTLSTLINAYNA